MHIHICMKATFHKTLLLQKFPKQKYTFNMQIVCDILNMENDFISFSPLQFLYYYVILCPVAYNPQLTTLSNHHTNIATAYRAYTK